MKITVFTSNQPRHLSLLREFARIADVVYAVQECNTVFPGLVKDFYDNSSIMQEYFMNVMAAEKKVFGEIGFLPGNVCQLAIKDGDLNKLDTNLLADALDSDYYIVFGASFIKAPLIDLLIQRKTINIHMGVSPFYRGSSCNFWALYDGHPELVGATIHFLSKELDAGNILFHALPRPQRVDPFTLGMEAVRSAHSSLVDRIKSGEIFTFNDARQDKDSEIRYTINADFNDEVVSSYMKKPLFTSEQIFERLRDRDLSIFINPFIK